MAVTSREGLKQYALRELGSPVVQINVADEQLEDRIDEAIEYFRLYHYDGIERMYLKHLVTEDDVNNQYITIPDYIYGVKRVIPFRQGMSSSNLFDAQYQLRLNDLYEITNTSLIHYTMVMQHVSMMDQILNGYPQFEFNRLSNKLYLEVTKQKIVPGVYIIIEAYRALDPNENTKMWGEPWLKKYVAALFKKMWGTNLKKFNNMTLPGGVSIDGGSLYLEALQEIKELEDDLMNKSAPLAMVIG